MTTVPVSRRPGALTTAASVALAMAALAWPAAAPADADQVQPGDAQPGDTRPGEVVVRWSASTSAAARAQVLSVLDAEVVRALSTRHHTDVVAPRGAVAHEVHEHVAKAAEQVAVRLEQREDARAELVEAEQQLAAPGGDSERERKAVEEAARELAKRERELMRARAKHDEERHKHADPLTRALSERDDVEWAEPRLPGAVEDDRFHAWRFHAWPHGRSNEQRGDRPDPVAWIDVEQLHRHATGDGVTIALMDTGVERGTRVAYGSYDFVDDDAWPVDWRNRRDDDGDGDTDEAFGHGNVVVGVVRALAPAVDVLAYRVLDADGAGDPHALALALDDAVDRGVDVVNLSAGMSSPYASPVLREAFERARKADVVVVAAAGNVGSEDPRFPAGEKEVVAVAALDGDSALARFSNRGKWAELAAPGVDVAGLLPDGEAVTWSGTSFAAPVVTAQFALLRELDPDAQAKDLRKAVREAARSVDGQHHRAVDLMASLED